MHMFSFLDSVLRRDDDFAKRLADPAEARRFIRSSLLWLTLLGAFYGLVMGSFQLFRTGSGWNAITSMIKVPILLLMTTALCFPALYIFGLAGGAKLRAHSLWAALLGSHVVLTLSLAALSPIVFFFLTTVNSYVAVKFIHVIVWGFAGLAGLKFLRGILRHLDPDLTKNARLMTLWMLLFALVGMQGSWMLRPFIGRPNQEFRAFRYLDGNIFEDLGRSMWRMGHGSPKKPRP